MTKKDDKIITLDHAKRREAGHKSKETRARRELDDSIKAMVLAATLEDHIRAEGLHPGTALVYLSIGAVSIGENWQDPTNLAKVMVAVKHRFAEAIGTVRKVAPNAIFHPELRGDNGYYGEGIVRLTLNVIAPEPEARALHRKWYPGLGGEVHSLARDMLNMMKRGMGPPPGTDGDEDDDAPSPLEAFPTIQLGDELKRHRRRKSEDGPKLQPKSTPRAVN